MLVEVELARNLFAKLLNWPKKWLNILCLMIKKPCVSFALN